MNTKTLTVQTLIISKNRFSTRDLTKAWAKNAGYPSERIRETKRSWRIRQRPPNDFLQESFRIKRISDGVDSVAGYLRG